jgi:hypothetical protein
MQQEKQLFENTIWTLLFSAASIPLQEASAIRIPRFFCRKIRGSELKKCSFEHN